VKTIRVIWLPGSITVEQRYHAAKALFESGLADWDTARQAVQRTPGILAAADDLSKTDEIVRRLREVGLHPQVTERQEPVDSRPGAARGDVGQAERLPERLESVLRDSLSQGEAVDANLHSGGQALVVTTERVLLIAPAAVATGAHWSGYRVRSIPFAHITSAELRAGWIGGQLRITVQDAPDTRGLRTKASRASKARCLSSPPQLSSATGR